MRPFLRRSLFLAALGLTAQNSWAQVGVGIGTLTPDNSAALHVSSDNRGVLFPRLALSSPTDASIINRPAPGLTVYNTTTAPGLTPGLVSNVGTVTSPNWQPAGQALSWSLFGNAATSPGASFLGTTDNQPLVLRTNNVETARLLPGSGALWLGQGNTSRNLFIGYQAGLANTATDNLFIGYQAGLANLTGSYNTFVGQNAGLLNTSGTQNTFLGFGAGSATISGGANTFLGYGAGAKSNTINSTFVGERAGQANTTGFSNTFLGQEAAPANTSGSYNTFLGRNSAPRNTTGSSNVFVGEEAGPDQTTANGSTIIGYGAGGNITTGYGNTFIGQYSGITTQARRVNATAIGYFAQVDQDNALVLGGTGTEQVSVGIGTTRPSPSALLELNAGNRGLLLPRVQLINPSDATTIPSPAPYLLVVNNVTRGGLTPGLAINLGTATAPQWTNINPPATPLNPPFLRSTAAALTLNDTHSTVVVVGAGPHQLTLPPASNSPGRIYTLVLGRDASNNKAQATIGTTLNDVVMDFRDGDFLSGNNAAGVSNLVAAGLTSVTIQSDGGAGAGGFGWVVINRY